MLFVVVAASYRNYGSWPEAYLPWDPKPLEPYFWMPVQCHLRWKDPVCQRHTIAERCAQSKIGLHVTSAFGHFANGLYEYTHSVSMSLMVDPPMTLVFSDETRWLNGIIGRKNYDVDRALKSFACVHDNITTWSRPLRNMSAHDAFWIDYGHATVLSRYSFSLVMAQLVLRPSQLIRQQVLEFEATLASPAYVAIHLRWLEGQCPGRIDTHHYWHQQRLDFREVPTMKSTADFQTHLCHMSSEYVRSVMTMLRVPEGTPVVLAHEREQKSHAARLADDFGATSYAGHNGIHVDMQLMLRARYFIGNPASTISRSVASIRCVMSEHHDPNSNLYCGPYHPEALF